MKLKNKNMSKQERFDFFYKLISQHDKIGEIIYAGKILQETYKKYPNNIALIYKDEKITYKQLYYRACRFAEKLKQNSVRQDDIVLIFFRNSIEFYVAYFAIWQIGAVVAPLNIYLKTTELTHIIHDSQAKLAVIDKEKIDLFKDLNIPILTQDDIDLVSQIPEIIPDFEAPDKDYKKMAALLYTSGTTGLPKGVMLSSENIMINMIQILAIIDFSESKSIYCVLPLFHCFAQNCCVWAAIFSASSVIIVSKIGRGEMLSALKHKPDIFLGVPALYGLLCMFKTAPLESVEYFVSGGDALPDKIRQMFALIYGRKICNGYGLTETSPLIAVDMEDMLGPTSCVGEPVIGMKCEIRNDQNVSLSSGQIGQLWVSGPNVMMGYYKAQEKTDEIIKDGWLATGDLAKINEYGKIVICGRIKDVIAQKGFKIYPQEIENVILKHPDVMSVGVVGQDDSVYGQVPVAFVNVRGKPENIEEQLRNLCINELAMYKVPRQFFLIDPMPLTATGKVDKTVLRKKV